MSESLALVRQLFDFSAYLSPLDGQGHDSAAVVTWRPRGLKLLHQQPSIDTKALCLIGLGYNSKSNVLGSTGPQKFDE